MALSDYYVVGTSVESEGTSVCRRSQHAALWRSPAARGTPPGDGSAPARRVEGTWHRWVWCSEHSRVPTEGDSVLTTGHVSNMNSACKTLCRESLRLHESYFRIWKLENNCLNLFSLNYSLVCNACQMVYPSWLLTLEARFSTNEIMEFLKSVAAVSGRLVTSVMLSLPSGHIPFSTGLELETRKIQVCK